MISEMLRQAMQDPTTPPSILSRHGRAGIVCAIQLLLWVGLAGAAPPQAAPAAGEAATGMVASLQGAAQRLLHEGPTAPFDEPMSINSVASVNAVSAQLEAVIARPFEQVTRALATPESWCSVLLLHVNNKGCKVADGKPVIVALKVVRKYDQPVESAYDLQFDYHTIEASPRLMSTRLTAAAGPLGTSNYIIQLDAAPVDDGHTVIRLGYSYNQNALTGLAMDLYFATVGSGKVGFTRLSTAAGEPVQYIGGVRGLVERNLLRYLFAIEAGADWPDAVESKDSERRLHAWFEATERHPRQLRELDLQTYLALKRPLMPQPKR